MLIFTVKDTVAEFYMQPFFARTKGEAIRSFAQAVNDDPKTSQIAAHPDQYELYYLGDFDEQTSLLVGNEGTNPDGSTCATSDLIGSGADFKNQ